MSTLTLNLENLGDLDQGSTKSMIDSDIALCVADLDTHGDDGRVREVTVKVKMWVENPGTPKASKRVVVTSKPSIPARMSGETMARTKIDRGKARLMFEDDPQDEEEAPPAKEDERESA